MSGPLVIYGAGGHAREILAIVEALNHGGAAWEVLGWLSDDESSWGGVVAGFTILGDAKWLEAKPGMAVALGIGNPRSRKQVADRLSRHSLDFPILVDPGARVMSRTAIGKGTVIMAGSVVSVDTIIGRWSSLNVRSSVNHDCRLGDFCTLGPGSVLAGNVTLGEGVELGANATCIPGISIGSWAKLGAGAVAIQDLPAEVTAVGVPARPISVH